MNELNLFERHSNLNEIPLSDQTKFRLNEIDKIRDYYNSQIQKRKTISKKLSKYIAVLIILTKL